MLVKKQNQRRVTYKLMWKKFVSKKHNQRKVTYKLMWKNFVSKKHKTKEKSPASKCRRCQATGHASLPSLESANLLRDSIQSEILLKRICFWEPLLTSLDFVFDFLKLTLLMDNGHVLSWTQHNITYVLIMLGPFWQN